MSAAWEFLDNQAGARSEDWELQLRPLIPADGVRVHLEGQPAWEIFCVQPVPHHCLQAVEAYVRDSDLILRFEQSHDDTFAFQLNYRLLGPSDLILEPSALENRTPRASLGIELWLSVQTNLLDSTPTMALSSRSPARQGWQLCSHAELVGDEPDDVHLGTEIGALVGKTDASTGVWLIGPADQGQVAIESSPSDDEQRVRLFGQFMEKGVIRRARMRFHLITGALSHTDVQALYREFADSPLPLTA